MNAPLVTCQQAPPLLHHVEAGRGEAVLLLHGSASTGAFWRQTTSILQPLYRTIAPDLIGYGRSPAWAADVSYSLDAEIHALQSLLPCCAGKYHLVGHSYGGVVALMLAVANPVRVRALTLIEPVFFAALRYHGREAAYRRFCEVRDAFLSALARGETELALREFVSFWAGQATWDGMPAAQRAGMVAMADKIVLDWHASFVAEADLRSLAALGARTLLLCGGRSPEPMLRLVEVLHMLMHASSCRAPVTSCPSRMPRRRRRHCCRIFTPMRSDVCVRHTYQLSLRRVAC
jgi:pimeloyl-ACP methyl ester carboxylesterase